ncbi:MAG TPA: thioredoxin family protein [Cyclobacteriaceae bacterium]|nr:thioredoxin family protein [Cyclobacteriaceae bacterium]
MVRFLLLLAVFTGILNSECAAQILDDAELAFQSSCENQRPVLIVFAGSDWCAPCIRFERKVFTQKEFADFASQKIVVYEADFPQRKKLSKSTRQKNDDLAEQYNPKGTFPYFVLVRPDRSVITALMYDDESVQAFINKISTHLEDEQAKNVQKTN